MTGLERCEFLRHHPVPRHVGDLVAGWCDIDGLLVDVSAFRPGAAPGASLSAVPPAVADRPARRRAGPTSHPADQALRAAPDSSIPGSAPSVVNGARGRAGAG